MHATWGHGSQESHVRGGEVAHHEAQRLAVAVAAAVVIVVDLHRQQHLGGGVEDRLGADVADAHRQQQPVIGHVHEQ